MRHFLGKDMAFKLSKYFCPRCGSERLLQDGSYCLCRKCQRHFRFDGICDANLFDGWLLEDCDRANLKEWQDRQPPDGTAKVNVEKSLPNK